MKTPTNSLADLLGIKLDPNLPEDDYTQYRGLSEEVVKKYIEVVKNGDLLRISYAFYTCFGDKFENVINNNLNPLYCHTIYVSRKEFLENCEKMFIFLWNDTVLSVTKVIEGRYNLTWHKVPGVRNILLANDNPDVNYVYRYRGKIIVV